MLENLVVVVLINQETLGHYLKIVYFYFQLTLVLINLNFLATSICTARKCDINRNFRAKNVTFFFVYSNEEFNVNYRTKCLQKHRQKENLCYEHNKDRRKSGKWCVQQ
jgi:hypothetical protein